MRLNASNRKMTFMIRINKSEPPEILANKGAERSREDCRLFSEDKENYLAGTIKFQFDRNIYSHSTVKEKLRKDQHGKCCYCEGKFEAHSSGDVEHYRPKGFVKQAENTRPIYPGYYWLAYSWNNLYYCCQKCNRSFKRGLFPLSNPDERACSHAKSIDIENPLILDPGGAADPRFHIEYKDNFVQGRTKIGRATVDILDLNRDDLLDQRLKFLKLLKLLLIVTRLAKDSLDPSDIGNREKASLYLRCAMEQTAEFSAMAIDYLHGEQIV